ncbi:hypothetical protein [Paenibacillus sacheonensis]|uniref:Uncharacterized protein n=1 Tax=Paenibacillus sacheonensis TaxID=742054 RepID=A0A7X5C0N0_9BACL|nr:hypothetical protein [Paenibacillus sacheonensis]MBM7569259.1 ribosomal protein L18E [Paenibacillus sacheonensis]NBC71731.1 hypothetical protein [Paenibacillus sacheonensis]
MRKKQMTRDLIYVNGREFDNHCFYSYGFEFYEFMSCVQPRPENLILLKHNFDGAEWNPHTRFDYVTAQGIKDLIDDNVYGYGDFCWVDFEKEEDLEHLSAQQIAELLYFSHLAKPLHDIPKARFAYYAHDDGWFNKLYVKKLEDFEELLSRAIVLKLRKMTRRSMVEIPNEIAKVLMESTKEGLLIDLSRMKKSKTEIQIPITAVGHFTDMDNVYELKEAVTDANVKLVYSKQTWKLIKEESSV